ncbi:alpha/beta fold hydrolase [Vibrio ostreicida]|uniref:Alpha/beta fold hydrolase n=1 Tax=Vibrio ostreicida TaxID=526588 RepID=A0ABT8BQD4_9VIBR|nr:alpha/beta fold hydrolase [Vibrio ostreicida]MDN3609027.1 alpha/beta fold hydrolase [Vibrio ostreicida]NPD07923.1 alpha/beta fold hydrolase [Vibrio ostreicida]
MNTFAVNDHQMAYRDIGQGPVIVFGHSYLWDSQMWAPQIDVLCQHYRCIVPDFWAHGESDFAPPSMTSLVDYAQHILALMDHLGVESFSVLGLSVGGMWGSEIVTLAPERVVSLVMMDTFVGLEPEVTHQKYFAMLETISAAQMVPVPIVEAVVSLFFAHQTMQELPDLVNGFRQRLNHLKGEQAAEVARMGRMVFGRRDQIEDIEKFDLPVLIAVGEQDIPRPVLESFLMHDCIKGSQLVQIPQAGHISSLEQPAFVTTMLDDFFAQVHA